MSYMQKTQATTAKYMFLQAKNVPNEKWMGHTLLEKMNSKGHQNNRHKITIFKLHVRQLN